MEKRKAHHKTPTRHHKEAAKRASETLPQELPYYETNEAYDVPPQQTNFETIRWQTAESVAPKSVSWYAISAVLGAALVAMVALLTRDIASTVTVFIALVILLLYAARKPRTQAYRLDGSGIEIGSKTYDIHMFKSFSVDEHGSQVNIVLMPLKRFMPAVTLPLEEASSRQVVDVLATLLPFEEYKPDFIDTLTRKIRL